MFHEQTAGCFVCERSCVRTPSICGSVAALPNDLRSGCCRYDGINFLGGKLQLWARGHPVLTFFSAAPRLQLLVLVLADALLSLPSTCLYFRYLPWICSDPKSINRHYQGHRPAECRDQAMTLNTLSVAASVTPTVVQTYVSHV